MPATARKMAPEPDRKTKKAMGESADRLGDLQAAIAPLADEAGEIIVMFKDEGIGTWQGDRFYVQVSDRKCADRIDRTKLYEHFGRDALIGLGIVEPGLHTLACSCKPRPDAADGTAEAA